MEYLDCGLGKSDDFAEKDLTDKIALIKRGEINFVDKIMNAQNHHAAGVIVYNHESGGEGLLGMQYPDEGTIPAVFIGNHDGEILKSRIIEAKNVLEFRGEEVPVLGDMSCFTSWGTTPNLDFKPDITYINTKKEQAILDADTGKMPISFSGTEEGVIIVPAGETVDFTVNLDLADPVCNLEDQDTGQTSLEALNAIFPNGTFIEGFIRLTETEEQVPELSIPYVGFYGEWDQAPIFDDSLYEEDAVPYYGTVINGIPRGTYLQSGSKILGLKNYKLDPQLVAISPNEDGEQDEVKAVLELMRNAREIDVDILNAQEQKLRDLDYVEYLVKNYNPYLTAPCRLYAWDGKINGGVTDGDYIYRIQARVDWKDAAWQTLDFPVRVDTVPPVIESVDYDEEDGKITIQASDGDFPGVSFILYNAPRGMAAFSEDGVFDLKDLSEIPYQVQVMVKDAAGNYSFSDPIIIGTDSTKPEVYPESPRVRGSYNSREVTVKGSIEEITCLHH
ncbi:MAG: PA domain-containing protein [Bacillota bacterium]|nr:PA domain-containing protein [Bacillota bacterium]